MLISVGNGKTQEEKACGYMYVFRLNCVLHRLQFSKFSMRFRCTHNAIYLILTLHATLFHVTHTQHNIINEE